MKNYINKYLVLVLALVVVAGCNQDEDVASIVPPTDNAVATVEQTNTDIGAVVQEGDTLWYSIVVDKPVTMDVDFTPAFTEASTADASDIEIIGGLLAAYSTSTTLGILIVEDGIPETTETLSIDVSSISDPAYNWQFNMDASNVESTTVEIEDFNYRLDWDMATHVYSGDGNTYDMCGLSVDLDMFMIATSGGADNYDGATGDCPEISDLRNLENGTYDIYVDFWANEFLSDAPADFEFPWIWSAANNDGDIYTYESTFVNEDAGADTRVIGTLVYSDGTFSITFN